MTDQLNILDDILGLAQQAGADAADAIIVQSRSNIVSCRNAILESSKRTEQSTFGVRVIVGQRTAVTSLSAYAPTELGPLVKRAVDTAKLSPQDPYVSLPDPDELLLGDVINLDIYDDTELSTDDLLEMAKTAEEATLAVEGVTGSTGGRSSLTSQRTFLASSIGFSGVYESTSFSTGVGAIAGNGMEKVTERVWRQTRHLNDLMEPAAIGETAGLRTVSKLGAKPIKTSSVPIVFDPRIGNSLLSSFATAISGRLVSRGVSFLKERMGKPVFAPGVNIIDDPLRLRGLSSRPFDGEGVATRRLSLIADGVLQSWILDSYTARQLKLKTTGSAFRAPGRSPNPSAFSLYLEGGKVSPKDLMEDIKYGLYVTKLDGMGGSPISGDFSQAAEGFLIENGTLTRPVKEVTVAGNLKDMFLALTPANDLEFIYGINVPTLRVDGMTVGGA